MLDDTDRRLLRHLQADPASPTAELAERAGVTAATCWRRLEKLTRTGVLKGQRGGDRLAGAWLCGRGLACASRSTRPTRAPSTNFSAAAREVPEVIEIQTFLGRVDVRLIVIARDMAHYQEIYREPHPDPAAYRRYRGADAWSPRSRTDESLPL